MDSNVPEIAKSLNNFLIVLPSAFKLAFCIYSFNPFHRFFFFFFFILFAAISRKRYVKEKLFNQMLNELCAQRCEKRMATELNTEYAEKFRTSKDARADDDDDQQVIEYT